VSRERVRDVVKQARHVSGQVGVSSVAVDDVGAGAVGSHRQVDPHDLQRGVGTRQPRRHRVRLHARLVAWRAEAADPDVRQLAAERRTRPLIFVSDLSSRLHRTVRCTWQDDRPLPIGDVHRRCDDLDEHLVHARRLHRHLLNSQHVRWAEPLVYNCPHIDLPSEPVTNLDMPLRTW
jgi:hypothetical protein